MLRSHISLSCRNASLPGLILTQDSQEDSPILPEKRKQKFYRSFVAKLQFAASWVRFDISYTVAQLARFCASAGSTIGQLGIT